MTLRVFSEIGPLERVLIHRPGAEIDEMVPAMMEHLLFDDILHGPTAREEHDSFTEILRSFGVETLDTQQLLEETLGKSEARSELLDDLEDRHEVSGPILESLVALNGKQLANSLVRGQRSSVRSGGQSWAKYFDLLPVPNYFFQRGPTDRGRRSGDHQLDGYVGSIERGASFENRIPTSSCPSRTVLTLRPTQRFLPWLGPGRVLPLALSRGWGCSDCESRGPVGWDQRADEPEGSRGPGGTPSPGGE